MGRRVTKANNSFMIGTFIMMFLVFLTVFIFLMWAFRINRNKTQQYSDRYEIVFDNSVLNHGMTLYVNDSLFFSGTPQAVMTLSVDRFSEEGTLLAVDLETDQVSLISLPEKSGKIVLKRDGNEFSGEITTK